MADHRLYCRQTSPFADKVTSEVCEDANIASERQVDRSSSDASTGSDSPPWDIPVGQKSAESCVPAVAEQVDLPAAKESELSCVLCNKTYTTKNILNRHMKQMHNVYVTSGYRTLHCPVSRCFRNCSLMANLRQHIADDHGMSEVNEMCVVQFSSETEFYEWKAQEERRSLSKYVKKHGRRRYRCDDMQIEEYGCNRSGFLGASGRGLRKTRSQGSVKINAVCPSTINAYFRSATGDIEVKYYPTHVGHDCDIEHLCLAKRERLRVEKLVAEEASLDAIFDAVRCDKSHYNAKIVQSLAAQGIRDAEAVYDLMVDESPSQTVPEDAKCQKKLIAKSKVSRLVSELLELGADSPLLDDVVVTDDRLLLFTMSAFQSRLFARFANRGVVCIDGVTSTSCSGLSVTSVSVILQDQTAFACAFCVHIGDELSANSGVSRFLKAIAKRAGVVRPALLLISKSPLHLDCWNEAMGNPPDRHTVCPWAVDRKWRDGLWRASTKPKKQAILYKSLHSLLTESDRDQFVRLSSSFVRHVSDRSYGKIFLKYFLRKYMSRQEQWAYSFQQPDYAAHCVQLESVHATLMATLDDPRAVHVDAVFHVLFCLIRGHSMKQVSLLDDDEVRQRAATATDTHNVGVCHEDVTEVVELGDRQWLVRSADKNPGDYVVEHVNDSCPLPRLSGDCGVRCDVCDVCVHRFLCTCVDSVVRGNICKHLHFVASILRPKFGVMLVQQHQQQQQRGRSTTKTNSADDDGDEELAIDDLRTEIGGFCATIVSNVQRMDSVERLIMIRDAARIAFEVSGGDPPMAGSIDTR